MLKSFTISTQGRGDILDITEEVEKIVKNLEVEEGVAFIFVSGSTAAISATEYEEGVKKDINRVLEELAPFGAAYEHHKRWGDQNGDAHIKSTLIGPEFNVPVTEGKLTLGTWQQIVLLDLDERPRERKIMVKVLSG
jgi:secondary thiamine-phosphate synthase enzyme